MVATMVRIKWEEKQAAIESLERNGKVDPDDLIREARDPSHPCHGDFTWDVDEAALERWRDQAKQIIRKCHFEYTVEEVTTRVVNYVASPDGNRMFLSLPKTRKSTTVCEMLLAELAQLVGLLSRVHGMALVKESVVGSELVTRLRTMRDEVAQMKEALEQ